MTWCVLFYCGACVGNGAACDTDALEVHDMLRAFDLPHGLEAMLCSNLTNILAQFFVVRAFGPAS